MQAGELLNDSPLASLMELLMAPGSNVYSNVNVLFCFVLLQIFAANKAKAKGEIGRWGKLNFLPNLNSSARAYL